MEVLLVFFLQSDPFSRSRRSSVLDPFLSLHFCLIETALACRADQELGFVAFVHRLLNSDIGEFTAGPIEKKKIIKTL